MSETLSALQANSKCLRFSLSFSAQQQVSINPWAPSSSIGFGFSLCFWSSELSFSSAGFWQAYPRRNSSKLDSWASLFTAPSVSCRKFLSAFYGPMSSWLVFCWPSRCMPHLSSHNELEDHFCLERCSQTFWDIPCMLVQSYNAEQLA